MRKLIWVAALALPLGGCLTDEVRWPKASDFAGEPPAAEVAPVEVVEDTPLPAPAPASKAKTAKSKPKPKPKPTTTG